MKLEIVGIEVKRDEDGLYCINDLHKAAGGEMRHRPNYWISSEQASDLIKQILITGKPAIRKSTGRYGGTYICKEMVYAYAMWISAEFQLKVIQAYDRQVNVQTQLESLMDQVRAKAIGISEAVDRTTSSLQEIKSHGSAWGAYGSSIRKTKKHAVAELKRLQEEIQLKLDLL